MINREMAQKLRKTASRTPIITLTGPRQSGKTTLAKASFPNLPYINLEPLDTRAFAIEDPRGFLAQFPNGAILDEVQNVPSLFSYIQAEVDARGKNQLQFLLTGSSNFALMSSISQSFAGRAIQYELMPLSISELRGAGLDIQPWEFVWKGGYPRLYDGAEPSEWLPSYIQNYVERDVRNFAQIGDLQKFQKFFGLCAGRIGQVLNKESLGTETGIDGKTIDRWLSILEASYIIFMLKPFHKNWGKRLIKSPKLYFWDTGLACNLLQVRNESDLNVHFARGNLFENAVIAERRKHFLNKGEKGAQYFFRDTAGLEVDLLEDRGKISLYEIKASATIQSDMFKNMLSLKKNMAKEGDFPDCHLVYAGAENYIRSDVHIESF